MNWELCGQPDDFPKRQVFVFWKGVVMLAFHFMMYYVSPIPWHLKFHYDQTICEWVDANSIMSNVTIEYDPVRKINSLDLVDAKSFDGWVWKT